MPATHTLAVILILLVACSPQPPAEDVVAGVSLELAQHRAATISRINYDLSFDIPAEVDDVIPATIEVRFDLSDNSRSLQLDFRESGDKIHAVTVNNGPSSFQIRDEHIVVPAKELKVGRNVINIAFEAGSSSLNRNPEYLYTLFVPDRARTAFPLFDQPDLKATFDLSLGLPPGWTAMSNAPIQTSVNSGLGTIVRFETSDLISSYLFSFVAGKFETVIRNVAGRQMTMLHRETDVEKVARNLDDIFNLHAAALDWLEAYTGIAYPYQKFGFALIPAFQYGGMEHVGAIQYRASSLFLDEAPSETRLLGRAGLIAHETAHMWFGNLVTMEWFNDVWTKEVFANFMAAKIVNPGFPDVNHDLNFLVRHFPSAYSVDRTAGANPIRQALPNLNEAGQMYGAIIYNKAPIMMRKLEKMIGEDIFQEGLREYLSAYAFANATWPALIEILDAKTDENLKNWSEDWVNTPGRAAVEAQWDTSAEGEGGPLRYGLVPARFNQLNGWKSLAETERAALLINLYEQLLAGTGPRPGLYLDQLALIVESEQNQLVLDLALNQVRRIFWNLRPEELRERDAKLLERILWDAMLNQEEASRRKVYFEAYADIALSEEAVARVRDIWSGELAIENLPLAENDLIDLAQKIAVRLPDEADSIIAAQIQRSENPDNVRKLEFIAPSLSAEQAVRDAFFESLAEESNRETESWVLDAVGNLHHPLRTAESEKYLLPSLELLSEIQVTGDIFFPKRWLDATLGNYRSGTAVSTVRTFLEERPDYNEQLRMKILQSADMLFRAYELVTAARPPGSRNTQ
ncbi:MAG: M1 family aminopeptidase [Gammaproteobacteria bacterium]|nr:M1 family aminopeptidase [Gammaproteobacteria bacterium]